MITRVNDSPGSGVLSGVLYVLASSAWANSIRLPVMIVFGLAALICARRARWGWAGALAGLSALSEPGGLLPLALVVLLAIHIPGALRRTVQFAFGPAVLALLAPALLIQKPFPFPPAALLALVPLSAVAAISVFSLVKDSAKATLPAGVALLVAWGACDTLLRAVLLRQPVTPVTALLLAVLAAAIGVRFFPVRLGLLVIGGGTCFLALVTFQPAHVQPIALRWPLQSRSAATPVALSFGPDLMLTGVSVSPVIQPGHQFPITLEWTANAIPADPLSIRIDAISQSGRSLPLGLDSVQVSGSGWFTTHHMLTLPAGEAVAPGVYAVYVTVSYQAARLGQLQVARVIIPVGPHPVSVPSVAILPDNATLGRPRIVVKNETLTVGLTWTSAGPLDHDYKVFLHIEDSDHRLVVQHDADVQAGNYPTSLWQPGDVIDDSASLSLADLPPGNYTLIFGMYTEATGRLSLRLCGGKTADSLVVATIQIAPDRAVTVTDQTCPVTPVTIP